MEQFFCIHISILSYNDWIKISENTTDPYIYQSLFRINEFLELTKQELELELQKLPVQNFEITNERIHISWPYKNDNLEYVNTIMSSLGVLNDFLLSFNCFMKGNILILSEMEEKRLFDTIKFYSFEYLQGEYTLIYLSQNVIDLYDSFGLCNYSKHPLSLPIIITESNDYFFDYLEFSFFPEQKSKNCTLINHHENKIDNNLCSKSLTIRNNFEYIAHYHNNFIQINFKKNDDLKNYMLDIEMQKDLSFEQLFLMRPLKVMS